LFSIVGTIINENQSNSIIEVMFLLKIKYWLILLVLVHIFSVSIYGCAQKQPAEKKPQGEEKPEAPPALESIRENLDMIIMELDNKSKQLSDSSLMQNTKMVNVEKPSAKGAENKMSIDDWTKEEQSIRKIYVSWNSIEPDAVKAGLSSEDRDKFEQTLDALTQNISDKQLAASALAAIAVYNTYADVTQVFKMSIPPEFFRLKYQTLSSIVEARRENWTVAETHSENVLKHWENIRMQATEGDKKVASRTDFSLRDLQEAIKNRKISLVFIKGEIAMENLKKLEDAF